MTIDVLDQLAGLDKASRPASPLLVAKAVRRMKRDRLTIRKMWQRLQWYDGKVSALQNELRRRAEIESRRE